MDTARSEPTWTRVIHLGIPTFSWICIHQNNMYSISENDATHILPPLNTPSCNCTLVLKELWVLVLISDLPVKFPSHDWCHLQNKWFIMFVMLIKISPFSTGSYCLRKLTLLVKMLNLQWTWTLLYLCLRMTWDKGRVSACLWL